MKEAVFLIGLIASIVAAYRLHDYLAYTKNLENPFFYSALFVAVCAAILFVYKDGALAFFQAEYVFVAVIAGGAITYINPKKSYYRLFQHSFVWCNSRRCFERRFP